MKRPRPVTVIKGVKGEDGGEGPRGGKGDKGGKGKAGGKGEAGKKGVKGDRGLPGPSGAGGGGSSGAPTQQVTVAGSRGGYPAPTAGLQALSAKVDALLRESREKKLKTHVKSKFTRAKKQYRAYRKERLSQITIQNKDLRKRALARIRKMPVAARKGARDQLKKQLKERLDHVKRSLPSKITTRGQLSQIMKQSIKHAATRK